MQEDGHSGHREGGGDPGGAPQHPLHTVDSVVFREGENQAHRITVVKIPEITLWITHSFSLSLSY